jgi:hypothetical protein
MKTTARALLGLLLVCACGSREAGTQLHLTLDFRPARSARTEGATRQFLNDRGDAIRLTQARVTLSSVEIAACQTSAAWRWLRALSPVGTAHAHSASNPQRLGTPHVSGLERADGEALALGTLEPPPGRYCRAHLVFAPADEDAEGLARYADMEGRTVVLEGEWTPATGGAPRAFRVESTGVFNADVALDAVALTPESLEAVRTVHLAYDQWLDGVDLAAPDASDRVLRNVARAVTLGP